MPIRYENNRVNKENPWQMSVTTATGQFCNTSVCDDFDDAVIDWLQSFGSEVGELVLLDFHDRAAVEAQFQASVNNPAQQHLSQGGPADPGHFLGTITIEGRRGNEVRTALRQLHFFQESVALGEFETDTYPIESVQPDPVILQVWDGINELIQEFPLPPGTDSLAAANDLLMTLQREGRLSRNRAPGRPWFLIAQCRNRSLWAAHIECHHAWAFFAPNHPWWRAAGE